MVGIRELSPELLEVAKKELNEDPGRREKDLTYIKDWLAKQPHLTANTNDQFLISFLRGCKFSLERTKEKLDSYYTMRTIVPELFARRDPMLPEMQEILRLGVAVPLKGVDALGRRVMIMRVGAYDANKISITDVFKMNMMMSDIMMLEDDNAVVCGNVSLLDLDKVTMGHMLQLQPTIVKKAMTCFQDAYPVRPKGINYIHLPPTFETALNLFKSFMKEKLKKRIFIHGDDMESVYKNLPKEVLPQEYGGNAGPIDVIAAEWKKKVESYRDYFLNDEKNRSDEKKRPGKPKTHEELFGVEGSFRQLNVD